MSFIQNFFTSRDNNANAETFVGQEGRLWFNPVTNQIYSSDGNTPGGIPLAGGGGNGSPGGSNSQVQFNNNGAFGGIANLTIDSATGQLSTVSVSASGNVTGGNLSTPGILDFTSGNAEIGTINGIDGWYYESSFSVSSQDTEPRGVFFKPDGTRMYVVGQAGDDIIQYNLGTAWDVTTSVYGNAFVVSGQGTNPYDVSFKSDGTAMYMLDGTNDAVYQYTLSGAWDVGTASYASKSFSVTSQESAPTGMWFKPDGTKFYITGTTGDDVNEYNLGTAWDISTGSFLQVSISVATYETSPEGLCFSADGTKMWIVGSTYNRITEFSLSTPWNVSTIAFVGYVPIYGSGPYGVVGASGLFVDTTAGVAYVSDYQNDRIFQYATDVSTGQFYGPQWTAQSNFNVGNNLSVNQNFSVSGIARVVGALTAVTSVSSPNFATTTATGTTSLITGVTTGTLNFATGITTGPLNQMTAQTTGVYTLGGTVATGNILIGQSTATQILNLGTGATSSANTKSINIAANGVANSVSAVTIFSGVAGNSTLTVGASTGNTTVSYTANSTVAIANTSGTALSVAGNVTGGNLLTNSRVITTPVAYSALTAVSGARAFVNDGNLVASGNFGAQVIGGGSNVVPVWSNGTNWYIG
jgi:sugar lactone lactonase YvrE